MTSNKFAHTDTTTDRWYVGLIMSIVFMMVWGYLLVGAAFPFTAPVIEDIEKIIRPMCADITPCGIEEIATWESKNTKHIHYTIWVKINVKENNRPAIKRMVFIYTLYPSGKLILNASDFVNDEEMNEKMPIGPQ